MKPIERLGNTFLIQETIGIIEALECLDDAAGKVLFVVDTECRLMGALTDGDIRRYLLKGESLDDTVACAYNRSPKSIPEKGFSAAKARAAFARNGITLLPVVSADRRVVDVVSQATAGSPTQKKKAPVRGVEVPVVIMAGGKGTRLDPFTKILPKPLVPLGDKPIIEIIMDRFHRHGVDAFYITVSHRAKMIKAYFEEFKTPYRIVYIHEEKPLGTAGGLKCLAEELTGPFFVSNSDIIIEEDYGKILAFHLSNKNELTIVASVGNYSIPYGVCEIERGGMLRQIREKPNVNYLVSTGMYVLDASVLKHIPVGEFYHITDLIADIKSKGKRIGVFPISEKSWIDIGDWAKYNNALEHFKA